MNRARKSRDRNLRIEPLESRQLLATGITAALNSAGVLTIKGTSKSDDILFREINGKISIEGLKTTWSATKVKSIAVKLGATGTAGGNDYVSFNSLANGGNQSLAENITITSGKGNDHVTLPDSHDLYFSGLGHKVVITVAGVTTLDGVVVDPLPTSPVTIGDYVWNDSNANGLQDSGETGIGGVTLTLTGTNGSGAAVTDHATTDSTGHYLFTETPGSYTVTVDASNFASGGVLVGDTADPSNPNPSSTGALLGGASDLNLDFGYFRKVTIGDYVWNDSNANGLQDSGETGIGGVTLTLTGTNGSGAAVTDHATTDSTGHYLFTETPGSYTVTVDASNFASGGVLVGDTADPSNPNPSSTGALLGGASDLNLDFGYFRKVTIGDYVWNDSNANGLQDSGETGIGGVTLTLTGTNGSGAAVTDHATTDSTGHYLFTETPGSYTVTVDASNFASGGVLVGDTADPSNPNPSSTGALLGGASDLNLDFGYFRKVTIGDYVWNDSNANGLQDSGETGIGGVTLTLTGTNGSGAAVTDHATTDSTGHYLFTETPGSYTVTVDASNFASGGVLVGDTADPSNPNPSSTGALLGGASDLNLDFGYFRKVTIGDYVWNDSNANGLQDSGETGIGGVTLTLTGTNGSGAAVTDHATTDSTGHYLFTETPGSYTVTVDASNFASGGVLVGDTADPSNPNPSSTGALLGGASDLNLDFGYFRKVTIGDYVWNDSNANGLQDSGETGIGGVTLTLTGTNGSGAAVTDHATTDSTGHYLFTETPGSYTVTVDASNFASGGVLVGDTADPSNPNPSSTGALLGGASDLNLDFGYHTSSNSGTWFDTHIQTVMIRTLADTDFQDGVLSRTDMIGILQAVAQAGAVTSTELTDLTSIVNDAALFGSLNYVQVLSQDVVLANPANAHYQGGTLGNLAAGSSATQLDELIDKWFLGTDHPTASGAYHQVSGSLFANGTVSYADIKQGGLGDCGLLAAFAEIAWKDPTAITSMFIVNGDGTYTVRFFNGSSPEYVTVDSQLPSGDAGTPNDLWVALAEKAYAQINEEGWLDAMTNGVNTYNAIAGTLAADALGQVTGQPTIAYASTFPASSLTTFVTAFNAGKLIDFSSDASPPLNTVVGQHEYAVISYDPTDQTVTLFNPWGVGSANGGLITLTWAQIQANFSFFDRTA